MLKNTYKNKKMFYEWIYLLPKIGENFKGFSHCNCPYCGKKEIDYLYIGYKSDRSGYMQMWCNACKHGIYVSRTIIPEGAKMIEMNDKTVDINLLIPEYIEIVPE